MSNYIISASTVLPISGSPLQNCSVAVNNGVIVDIGNTTDLTKRYIDFTNINLGTGILLPGFINCHVHLELAWMKPYIGGFTDFTGWLEFIMKTRAEIKTDEDTISESVKNGIEELINCGVTTVGEISSFGETDLNVLEKFGLRTVLFRELTDSNFFNTEWEQFGEKDNSLEVRPFPHAPYSCSPELIEKVIEYSVSKRIPLAIHLAESREEVSFVRNENNDIEEKIYGLIGKKSFKRHTADSPVKYIFDGFSKAAESKITAIHMVQVDKADIAEIKESDTGIVLCPRSNIFLGVGKPPLVLYRDMERIGLGTDGLTSNEDLDFFKELKCLNTIGADSFYEGTEEFTLYTATLGGAKALFIEDKTGSIEINKFADLQFINTNAPGDNPYRSVVNSTPRDVEFVMIGGKIVKNRK